MKIKLSNLANLSIVVSVIFALMYFGQGILIPIVFSVILAFLLYPVCDILESKLKFPRILSIITTYLLVIILFVGIGWFFGAQLMNLFKNIQSFGEEIRTLIKQLIETIDKEVLGPNISIRDFYLNGKSNLLSSSTNFLGKTIISSTNFLVYAVLIIVYTFLFLLYRTSFKVFILNRFGGDQEEEVQKFLFSVRRVSQKYFYGLFMIILILGILNGTGLLIIGIDYPYLFGFLAALLAIIPYIGTFIGGMLPTIYALINYDSIWMPVFVIMLYTGIQTIEGNILTPNIVGSRVSLNPLVALVALITGGIIWGIAGMILFIPLTAVLKVVFDHFEPTKPFGRLMGSDFRSLKKTNN